jgi:hypothetical protein
MEEDEGIYPTGYVDQWNTVLVHHGPKGVSILLGAVLENIEFREKREAAPHYLCSTGCLFAHITKLLKLDSVAQHR